MNDQIKGIILLFVPSDVQGSSFFSLKNTFRFIVTHKQLILTPSIYSIMWFMINSLQKDKKKFCLLKW